MKIYKIYKLVCLITNMSYIGQTINDVIKRIDNHIIANSLIGKIIRKYELKNFKLEVIWEAINKKEADIVEKAAIFAYNTIYPNGYNLTVGGNSGEIHSETTKNKMRKSHLGKKNSEHSKRMQGNQNAKGKHWKLSEEVNREKSIRMQGNKFMQGKKNPNAHSAQSEIKRLKTRLIKLLKEGTKMNRV